jgi:hypothetical protein
VDPASDAFLVAENGFGDDDRLIEPLTPRELEALQLLADGLPDKATRPGSASVRRP